MFKYFHTPSLTACALVQVFLASAFHHTRCEGIVPYTKNYSVFLYQFTEPNKIFKLYYVNRILVECLKMYGFGEAITIASPGRDSVGHATLLRRKRRTTEILHAKFPNSKQRWTDSY